ncbi:hypothetical protein ACTOB_003709 [Actinoplanes oblitus]|uniref:Uncharacterized protein n=1 Tax=Actinoplanes oblitus TaxID=3040509 RepID=A0ABY8WTR1_9ACTN|nr:hypothetical protein [Actinoplanes oblitus]WIN00034.1 hypothetical protein ACTOB_003709 [Actinoplanes oblitus]
MSTDIDLLHQLTNAMAGPVEDIGSCLPPSLVTCLDAGSRSFGSDVAQLIDECVEHGVLTFDPPVTGIRIEPTVSGERRDGGFRLLMTLDQRTTLASPRVNAELFLNADDPPLAVLAVVVDTANRLLRAAATTLPIGGRGGRA